MSWIDVLIGLVASALLLAAGLFGVAFFLVKLPADYFLGDEPPTAFWDDKHPILRWTGRSLKNLAGLVTVALGVVMTLPGVPGPGLLTILLGSMLLDYPGKRRFERWIIRHPALRGTAERVRRRYGKPPLILEEEPQPPASGEDRGGAGR